MRRHRGLLLGGVLALTCLVVLAGVLHREAGGGGPDSPTAAQIGVYMSHNNVDLDTYTAEWQVQPNVASFYVGWDTSVESIPQLAQYAAEGRTLQVELATKYPGGYVRWADVAKGTYDAHVVGVIRSLERLGAAPVMLSLDNEPDAKATSGTGEVAAGQTAAEYVAAANHVADLIHAHSRHVQSLVWLAGFQDAATSASFLPAHSALDNVGWDPYKNGDHPVSETPTQLFATFIDTVLVPHGYGDIPRHILETGIQTDTFTTQEQVDFWNGIPAAMSADDIASVVWFRDDSGKHPRVPTDPATDEAFAAMVADTLG